MKNQGLKTVILRSAFYRDNYRRVVMALLLVTAINVVLGFAVFHKLTASVPPQYFATTADGRLINVQPLSTPVVSDSYVLQWTANKVRAAFSQDYLHWRGQLQAISGAFTPDGWRYFLQSMQQSNNLKTLEDLKMVSNAEITGAPKVVEKEVVSGHYAWKIEVPVLVTYNNAKRSIPMPMNVTLIVLRMPVKDYPDRIAINNFLPEVQKTPAQQLGF